VSPEPDERTNDWFRRKNRNKVKVGSSTFALPAGVRVNDERAAVVDATDAPQTAAVGGADGGAGRGDDDRGERSRDPNDVIREAVGLRQMRKWGF
jgi:hypothetical protein